MVTYKNIMANFAQINAAFFGDHGGVAPPDTTVVTWLPFYHDMGLHLGIIFPVLTGFRTVLASPVAFLQRPARWMQWLAQQHSAHFRRGPTSPSNWRRGKPRMTILPGWISETCSASSTAASEYNLRRCSGSPSGSPRSTFRTRVLRPSYGMAEATLYVATHEAGQPPQIVHFDSEQLTAGHAKRREDQGGTALVSYGVPRSPIVRIVDPETSIECPAGSTGEIWVHGDNVATGYWQRPQESEQTFGATLVTPSAGTPEGPWLRTGDSGFISDEELFIIGRIKDILVVYGRNHSPDDLEATIQSITPGRCAAIAVPDQGTEKVVAIIELKDRTDYHENGADKFGVVKRQVTSAISHVHGLSVADLVVVAPGSIPITTSGKVRRAACVERYRQNQFARLDA